MQRFDIVILGATGYTGKFVVREWLRNFNRNEKLTWAIAGRSQQKLTSFIDQLTMEFDGLEKSSIEFLIVDVKNDSSVRMMCEKAKLVINCVGPYRFYGETVIKQCIESKTHHIDVSGEPEYLERMQLNYSKSAADNNIYIVGSCGFDSIPADLGVLYTQQNSKFNLEQVESYLILENHDKTVPVGFNYATWESAVHGKATAHHLRALRKQLFVKQMPKPVHRIPKRVGKFGYFFDELTQMYCMEFIGSDKSVVQRTNYINYDLYEKQPIQYQPYFTITSYYYVLMFIVMGSIFELLTRYSFGRYLLLKFYRFFSGGLARKESDIETKHMKLENLGFKMQFRGFGQRNESQQKPFKRIVTEITGPEPGYITTSKLIINSALVILKERENLPKSGGVYTPGAAFANTTLIDRLIKSGLHFNVVYSDEKDHCKL